MGWVGDMPGPSGGTTQTGRTATSSRARRIFPRRRMFSGFSTPSSTRMSSMKVPLVEPRSRTRMMSFSSATSAWNAETEGSEMRKSLVGFRPNVLRPGTSSNAQGLSIHLKTERTITMGAALNLAEKGVFNKGIGDGEKDVRERAERGNAEIVKNFTRFGLLWLLPLISCGHVAVTRG